MKRAHGDGDSCSGYNSCGSDSQSGIAVGASLATLLRKRGAMISWLNSRVGRLWPFRDPKGNAVMLRRLVTEYGIRHYKLYAAAYVLMGLGGACAGLIAYMAGNAANAA